MTTLITNTKYDFYQKVKNILEKNNFEVGDYSEINYGLQFFVINEQGKYLIRIYESKKGIRLDLSQVKNLDVVNAINNLLDENHSQQANITKVITSPFNQTFVITELKTREELASLIEEKGGIPESSSTAYIEKLYNLNGIKVTFYTSGRVLLQGKQSTLSNDLHSSIVEILKKEHRKEFTEEIEGYFVETTDFEKFLEETDSHDSQNLGEERLGKSLFNYLNINDQIDLLDALTFYEYVRSEKIQFHNYAILVRNFAIVYEGFLIKIFIDTGLLSEEQYEKDARTNIGKILSEKEILLYIRNSSFNRFIATSLESVWQSHRNKNLHSNYLEPKIIDNFSDAEHDIEEVLKVMKECFNLLDFNKFGQSFIKNDNQEEIIIKSVDIDNAASKLARDAFNITHQKKANWIAKKGDVTIVNINNSELKVYAPETSLDFYRTYFESKSNAIPNELIGTDESGKGDYFGPLVIAGVYVNDEISKKLTQIGVTDSKKLSDIKIKLLANKIKELCPFEIITIGNTKYNELYGQFKNLNNLLAWGHARAIENMLGKIQCDFVLSDQFGDEQLIKRSLMEKGKKITLMQRHKAEENIAVAAASILARNEFVLRLEQMHQKYGVEFQKGASQQTIENAKEFIQKHGNSQLQNVAKLHFKTTRSVL